MATLSTWKGHLQVTMMQLMTVSMLFVSGAWSQVAEKLMANQMTMKRRVIWGWGRVQTRPSVRRRVRVCKSAVLFLVISINAVVSAWVLEVGCVVGKKSL